MSDTPSSGTNSQLETLRDRKKRLMRELISNTATMMFLERGFDEVRVSDVAEACDVSEKTIYNYFPTKESLLLDREEAMAVRIRDALGPNATKSPVEAAVAVLTVELDEITAHWKASGDNARQMFARFRELLDETPSLRAAQRDMADRLAAVATGALAERAGLSPSDPEPHIMGQALMGLWDVLWESLSRYRETTKDPEEVQRLVMADLNRAARILDVGLWSFGSLLQGGSREQMLAATEAAQRSTRQVVKALRQAHKAWREMHREQETREREEMRQRRRRR